MATALITGAASGMGLEYTKIFADRHDNMVLVDVNEAKLLELKEEYEKYGLKVMVVIEDLTKDESAKKVYDKVAAEGIEIEYLINNAGFGDFGRYIDIPYGKERALMGINCITLMYFTHLYANDMVKRGHGRILNVASIASYVPGPYMPLYYASKAFVNYFSEAVAHELRGTGVTVTTLAPGPTKTSFEKNAKMEGSKMFAFKPLAGGSATHTAQVGVEAMMKGKLLVHSSPKHTIFKFLCRLAPEQVKLFLDTYINIGKIK